MEINDEEVAIVEQKILDMAKENNWDVTRNVTRISKAKLRFFGMDGWGRCPCYPPDDTIHGCGTEACTKEIEEHGKCHCNLYLKK